jgi:hypothetical protein
MKRTLAKLYCKKDYRHSFHLEKSDILSLSQLKIILEQAAWEIRRLLESTTLYRQNFATQLNELVKNLLKSQSYYQQGRLRKILER